MRLSTERAYRYLCSAKGLLSLSPVRLIRTVIVGLSVGDISTAGSSSLLLTLLLVTNVELNVRSRHVHVKAEIEFSTLLRVQELDSLLKLSQDHACVRVLDRGQGVVLVRSTLLRNDLSVVRLILPPLTLQLRENTLKRRGDTLTASRRAVGLVPILSGRDLDCEWKLSHSVLSLGGCNCGSHDRILVLFGEIGNGL